MNFIAKGTQSVIKGSDNLLVRSNNAMFYIANPEGKRLSPRCYKEISEFVNGLAVVTLKTGAKTKKVYIDGEVKKEFDVYPKGVIDINGVEILKPIYEQVYISSNCIRICVDDKWGYADFEGRIICEPNKDFIEKFENGCARERTGALWGVISFSNECLIPEEYRYLSELRNGKRVAKRDVNFGVIDNRGNVIEPFIYNKMLFGENNNEVILTNAKTGKTFIL